MDRNLEFRKERRAAQYKVSYFAYRFLSLASLIVLGGEGIAYWFSGSRSPLALVGLVVSVGYWSAALWSCPNLLSGQWERRLPEFAVIWRPSLLWIPLLGLAILGSLLFHGVLLFFMVLALMPSLWEALPLMIASGNLLVMVPFAVGMVRLYWHMRTGRAMEYRRDWATNLPSLAGDKCHFGESLERRVNASRGVEPKGVAMGKVEGIEAVIYFSDPRSGGRQGPVFSGYRPAFWLGGSDFKEFYDGTITLLDETEGLPGKEYRVRVSFLVPDIIPDTVRPGMLFTVQEGGRTIGRGIVREVFWRVNGSVAP